MTTIGGMHPERLREILASIERGDAWDATTVALAREVARLSAPGHDEAAVRFSMKERIGVHEGRRDSEIRWIESSLRTVRKDIAEGRDPSDSLINISRHAATAATAAAIADTTRKWLDRLDDHSKGGE